MDDKTKMLVEAVVKGVVAAALVGMVVYTVVTGVSIPDQVMQLVFSVLGVYFGFSAGSSGVKLYKGRKK